MNTKEYLIKTNDLLEILKQFPNHYMSTFNSPICEGINILQEDGETVKCIIVRKYST